ncbi:hypothetical protein X801_08068 [Opisthorchis viverrini]|uniref:Uncharacterized protein n=1 Tax=Opisthorchis viverrini TaxID=6198 RepID=A0A1S8WP04_OPIVI|nr:hypothetical protein X801_08068 [Opisthorchis viverrini]
MRHSRIASEHLPIVYYANCGSSANEESKISSLVETFHSDLKIPDYVSHHWNISRTGCDLGNMRSRHHEVTEPSNVLEFIRQLIDNRGCFSLNELKALLSMYSEVLLYDSTTREVVGRIICGTLSSWTVTAKNEAFMTVSLKMKLQNGTFGIYAKP